MRRVPREVIERLSREEYQRHVRTASAVPITGIMEAVLLLDRREFIFRGRAYRVPPVPWRLAAEILDVREQLRNPKPGGLAPTLRAFERAARLSKQICRPVGFFRRLLWPLTPNPFRLATPWQVGKNLGFFSTCLVLDQEPFRTTLAASGYGTSSPISPGSSNGSRHGSTAEVTQSPGRIS